MVHGGVCLANTDTGVTVFVDGGLPGELVEVELHHRKKRVWFGRVSVAVEPSPHRVHPPCPYVGACGGCQLQHVEYAHQLELKRSVVEDAMHHVGIDLPSSVPVHGMEEPWRYRWRGEFHVVPPPHPGGLPGLGFNRLRSWTPIAVDDCLIHHPTITRALPMLKDMVAQGGQGGLDVLHLTVGDDGRELLLRAKPRERLSLAAIDAVALTLPEGTSVSTSATTLHWHGQVFRAEPESFIQVNQSQMDVLYACVLGALGDVSEKRIIDAYAGIGLIGIALADIGAKVVCIESNRVAARLGVLNAQLNGVADGVRYVAEPVESVLPDLGAEMRCDALILDPPRAGCDSRVMGWLALSGPDHIVYISCDPATLARDLHLLVASGPYTLDAFDIVDMFPHTHHVECVASLRIQ